MYLKGSIHRPSPAVATTLYHRVPFLAAPVFFSTLLKITVSLPSGKQLEAIGNFERTRGRYIRPPYHQNEKGETVIQTFEYEYTSFMER